MNQDEADLEEFIETWLIHNATTWPDSDLRAYCHHDPERAWQLISVLTEQDLSDSQMGQLGAGPIEDLMRWHGERFIGRLEALAASNEVFRECLKRSYSTGPNDEIKRRMGIASGISWVDYSGDRAEISPVLIRYNRQWGLRPLYERGRFLGMSVTSESDDPDLAALQLTRGDLIVSVNGINLSNPTRAREALVSIADPRTLRLGIIRNEQEIIMGHEGFETGA